MSFTTEVKEELSRVAPTCSHCENATLAALIRIEGTLLMKGQGKYALEIATDSPVVARFIIKALHESYQLTTDLTMRRSVLHKTPNWLIEVPAQPGLNEALIKLGVLGREGEGLERGIDPDLIRKQCCASAYLRGVFLGSGFISNPRGDFHFELKVETQATADAIVAMLADRGIKAKVIQRRNSYLIYLKSGAAISSFLALVGAHQSALKMENERVVKSVRNDVNRRVNAEIANQAKASAASVDQIMTIRYVLDHRDISVLPQALQEYIKLRLAYPDATLKELGEAADPPLSKSAINHRVRRLDQLAQEIARSEHRA
ncbi:DNA-binding protein WhiA [Anaerotardibacter muris]|uniref:DNA-binding protein WhiA n=1 Tax=Anaerotardibacter muris TaxID=2941505 RepID=UPI00203FA24D|nr:DNA-binding protein WhiA [Anaerotardibacter muris]